MKPVVLLPAAALSGLSPEQLQAILAHELAHVRRHDYLVNLLQSMVETLLFYHPAMWWVSAQVRAEREHCCDDLAVDVCGDRLVYVTALAELTTITSHRAFALAATDGSMRRPRAADPRPAARDARADAGLGAARAVRPDRRQHRIVPRRRRAQPRSRRRAGRLDGRAVKRRGGRSCRATAARRDADQLAQIANAQRAHGSRAPECGDRGDQRRP